VKLLVVDDEINIRTGIQEGIDWDCIGISKVCIAADAYEALDIFKAEFPEIVITDIRMPGMDGLELIEKIMKISPYTKFVILSGYSEFEYAKKGMQLGVVDYELKPVKVKKLIDIVSKIKDEINKNEENEKEIGKYIESYKKKFLTDVFNGAISEQKDILEGFNKLYGFDISGTLVCLALEIDNYYIRVSSMSEQEKLNLSTHIADMVTNCLNPVKSVLLEKAPNQYLIICKTGRTGSDQSNFKANLHKMFNYLSRSLTEKYGLTVSMGISGYGGVGNMPEICRNSLRAIQYKLYKGKNSIIYFDEINSSSSGSDYYLINDETEKEIKYKISNFDLKGIHEILKREFDNIKARQGHTENGIRNFCLDLINVLIRTTKENGVDFDELFKDNIKIYYGDKKYDTLEDYKEWVLDVYREVIGGFSDLKGVKRRVLMLKAVEYIKKYYDRDITIENLSEYVGKTPNYFSHLFKKEFGVSFSEYLNKVRIEKAKSLLRNTNLLSYEIAEKVGFSDNKYFTQVFKKFAGCSPFKYRNQ